MSYTNDLIKITYYDYNRYHVLDIINELKDTYELEVIKVDLNSFIFLSSEYDTVKEELSYMDMKFETKLINI